MKVTIIGILVALAMSATAAAAVPPMISYQGKLMQPSGAPVSDETYSIQFAIYDVPTGGTPLWSETNPNVQTRNGLFSVLLGSVINLPSNIFDNPDRWFSVKIGSDPEMAPRQKISSVAYAQTAGNGVPTGTIVAYGGTIAPDGWLLCNGQGVSRSQYDALFAAIGTAYGAGDGSSTFNLPDFQDRFPIGKSSAKSLGSTGGSATVNLQHSHVVNSHTHTLSGHTHAGPSHTHTYQSTTINNANMVPNNVVAHAGGWNDRWVYGAIDGGNTTVDLFQGMDTKAAGSGSTGSPNNDTSGGASPGTNNQLSTSQSVLNPYQTVNYIIKM